MAKVLRLSESPGPHLHLGVLTGETSYLPKNSRSESEGCSVVSDSLQLLDCSLPGSSVHGILQARILEWVAVPFSKESSQPKNRTQVSHIRGGSFTF